jgi:hypothetical protein
MQSTFTTLKLGQQKPAHHPASRIKMHSAEKEKKITFA